MGFLPTSAVLHAAFVTYGVALVCFDPHVKGRQDKRLPLLAETPESLQTNESLEEEKLGFIIPVCVVQWFGLTVRVKIQVVITAG